MIMNEFILNDDITAISWGTLKAAKEFERVVIPHGCTYIDKNAFIECISLKEIIVSEENATFTSIDF